MLLKQMNSPFPESAFLITTSSLQYFFPGILVGLENFPEDLRTSPGFNMGEEEESGIEFKESAKLIVDSIIESF